MHGDSRSLEVNGFDPGLVAGDPAYGIGGGGGGGELVRALEALPQRMADVEELAITDGLHKEVHTTFFFFTALLAWCLPVAEPKGRQSRIDLKGGRQTLGNCRRFRVPHNTHHIMRVLLYLAPRILASLFITSMFLFQLSCGYIQ